MSVLGKPPCALRSETADNLAVMSPWEAAELRVRARTTRSLSVDIDIDVAYSAKLLLPGRAIESFGQRCHTTQRVTPRPQMLARGTPHAAPSLRRARRESTLLARRERGAGPRSRANPR